MTCPKATRLEAPGPILRVLRLAAASLALAGAAPAEPPSRAVLSALWREAPADTPGASPEVLNLTAPGELCQVRGEDLAEIGRLAIGDRLAAGDILRRGPCPGAAHAGTPADAGPGSDLLVELTCGDGTVLRFAREFIVLVREPGATDCAVDLARGALDVLTDRPAEITSGGVTIGVEGTRLTVLREADGGSSRDRERVTCWLFDGRVKIDAAGIEAAPPRTLVLETGERWTREGGEFSRGAITADVYPVVAGRNARLDAARALVRSDPPGEPPGGSCRASACSLPPERREETVGRLEKLYSQALAAPRDAALRTELAIALLELGLEDRALLELQHAGLDDAALRYDADPDRPGPRFEEWTPPDRTEPEKPPEGSPEAVQKVALPTVLGVVMVTLPRELRHGERVSGSLSASGAGEGSKAGKNLEQLVRRYRVAIGGEAVAIAEGAWSVALPAGGEELEVALQTTRGKPRVHRTVELAPPVRAPVPRELTAPAACRPGVPMTVAGPFDGDARTTRVLLGGEPVPVLAETPRGAVVDCPSSAAGPRTLTVEEGGLRLEGKSLRVFDLDFKVLERGLSRGEVSQAVLHLRGLAGLERPVGVRIRNLDPRVVRLEGGDEQLLVFSPADWGPEGAVTRTFRVVGRRDGKASIEAELVLRPPGP